MKTAVIPQSKAIYGYWFGYKSSNPNSLGPVFKSPNNYNGELYNLLVSYTKISDATPKLCSTTVFHGGINMEELFLHGYAHTSHNVLCIARYWGTVITENSAHRKVTEKIGATSRMLIDYIDLPADLFTLSSFRARAHCVRDAMIYKWGVKDLNEYKARHGAVILDK